ncbi:3210_t:CDS:2, partial [Gigaspora rosea]
MKRSNRTTRSYIPVPKLRIKLKKPKYEEIEEISVSDKTSEHSNTEPTYWSSKEHLNEETESVLTTSYTLLNETSLVDIIEVPVECDEFDVNSLYEITDNELLPEASVDSGESDIEVSINSVLENTSSDFKGFDGEYGPYFSNFISAMIFTWVTKHMVSTSEYEDLVKIITHPEFRTEDVPKNIWQVRRWRNRLPLVETRQHDVPLCMKKTLSTYKSTKKAFTISPLIHLECVLNNPALMPEMYFGPRVVTKEKQEFCHGELWQDSLLFGEYEIKNNE